VWLGPEQVPHCGDTDGVLVAHGRMTTVPPKIGMVFQERSPRLRLVRAGSALPLVSILVNRSWIGASNSVGSCASAEALEEAISARS
jgi:hypothetical protein